MRNRYRSFVIRQQNLKRFVSCCCCNFQWKARTCKHFCNYMHLLSFTLKISHIWWIVIVVKLWNVIDSANLLTKIDKMNKGLFDRHRPIFNRSITALTITNIHLKNTCSSGESSTVGTFCLTLTSIHNEKMVPSIFDWKKNSHIYVP